MIAPLCKITFTPLLSWWQQTRYVEGII